MGWVTRVTGWCADMMKLPRPRQGHGSCGNRGSHRRPSVSLLLHEGLFVNKIQSHIVAEKVAHPLPVNFVFFTEKCYFVLRWDGFVVDADQGYGRMSREMPG